MHPHSSNATVLRIPTPMLLEADCVGEKNDGSEGEGWKGLGLDMATNQLEYLPSEKGTAGSQQKFGVFCRCFSFSQGGVFSGSSR